MQTYAAYVLKILPVVLAVTLSDLGASCFAQSTAAGAVPRAKPNLSAGSSSAPASLSAQEQAKELNRKAIALQAQGKLTEACALYRQAVALNAAAAGYHNNLALVLKDLDQTKEAEAQQRIALKIKPKRADYHVNLGIILQRQKRFTEAEAAFKEALAMDAGDSDCHYRLGQTYLDMADFPRAIEESKLALMLKPDSAEYNELMGDVYMKDDKLEDAMLKYRRVIELNAYTPATISGELKAKIDFIKTKLRAQQ